MSCIVSERGTQVSTPIFHVFCTRKIFFYFLGIIASLASARSRKNPEKSIGEKSDFFDFPELHQVPYGTPKMTPKNSKMIQTSTHNIFWRIFSIRFALLRWRRAAQRHSSPNAFGLVFEMASGRLRIRPRAIRRPRGPRQDRRRSKRATE